MTTLLGTALVAVLLAVIALSLHRAMPHGTQLALRLGAGLALGIGAAWALIARQAGVALGLAGLAAAVLGPLLAARRGTPSPGGRSAVETSALAMELDHATGAMEGSVRVGAFAGRRLDDLDPEELDALLDELSQDADSLALLTAWLERRASGPGPVPPPDPSSLSEEEALRILGLTAGATAAEIRAAHRRLMRKVHPDLGGTPALAAMINAARARLDPTQEDD